MASPPSTPPPELPTSSKGWRFKNDRTLCEWGEQYRPGGLHPVSLGDTFCAGKYKVIRKLGSGAFSTVWLAVCESVPRYVAIKITKAKATVDTTELAILEHLHSVAGDDPDFNHVTKLLDHFQHDGPNGTHLCLVFEVMSTTAASLVYELPENQPKSWLKPDRYPKWIAKRLLRHTLHGLAFLHRNGVVHGDVQPGNLLFSANNIGVIELKDLAQHEAEIAQPLIRADGKRDRWAPKSVYPQESLHKYAQLDQDLCVKVSDLGAAFYASNPPEKTCTPLPFRAPELILRQPFNAGIDIWSFGCLVFEFITGSPLFAVMLLSFDQKERDWTDDDHLCQMNDIIAPLPASIISVWSRASKWYDADHNRLKPEEDEDDAAEGGPAVNVTGNESEDEDDGEEPYIWDSLEKSFASCELPDIDEEEATVICQLVRQILVFDPAERPSAEELLKHPWFAE